MCVCGSSGGRKGMNSPQTLATQTEAFRAALISVQSVRGKYKRHCFSSKPTLKCGWTPPNTKNPISVPLLNIPSCNDDDLSAADKPRHCKHKAFFFFFHRILSLQTQHSVRILLAKKAHIFVLFAGCAKRKQAEVSLRLVHSESVIV